MRPAIEAEASLAQVDREIANMGPSLQNLEANATHNQRRLRNVEAQLAETQGANQSKLTDRLGAAAELRQEAEELYDAAAAVQANYDEHNLQMFETQLSNTVTQRVADEASVDQRWGIIAHLEAQAKSAEASLVEADAAVNLTAREIKKLGTVEIHEQLMPMLHQGYRQFGANTQLPEDMVEAMTAAARISTPDGLKAVVGAWDRVQGLWKSYQVTSPGFHFRNSFGGVNNNWQAGIDEAAYAFYGSAVSDVEQLRRKNPLWAEAFESFDSHGFRTGGQTAYEIESNAFQSRSMNPLSRQFVPLRANRVVGEKVENFLRGSLYMDGYVKARRAGMAADRANTEAMARMLKFHFDYEDLSRVERSVVRRVIPFYTWTRKNLPLQLEMMAKQPEKINRYFKIKRNVETMSEEEGVVPDYFQDSFAMRLPWAADGGQTYAMPDLPMMSLAEITDPGMTAGMVTPALKTPYELWAGKQVFKGLPLGDELKPMPPSFAVVPGLKEGLRALGWAERGSDGVWYSSAKGNYLIDQALPVMARVRRMLPGAAAGQPAEERFEDRFWTTMLSFNMGLGVRTNTRDEQEDQLWSRYYDVKEELERAQQLGYAEPGRIGQAEVMEAVG